MHRLVTVDSDEYDFAPDDGPPAGQRWFALATAQLVDEILETPIRVPFAVRVDASGVGVRTGPDGTFALVATPQVSFPPAPGPRPVVAATVTADGYLPRTIVFTIPFDDRALAAPAPVAGDTVVTLSSALQLTVGQMLVIGPASGQEFAGVKVLGPGVNQVTLSEPLRFAHAVNEPVMPATRASTIVALHRTPVAFRGRVVRNGPAGSPKSPVPNATIALADFWRTQRAVRTRPVIAGVPVGDMTTAGPKTFAAALSQGVLAPRRQGADAGGTTLPAASGDEKQLALAAEADASAVRFTDRRNLIATDLVRIDSPDPERSEIHTVKNIAPVGGVTDPASIQLDHPLLASHVPGARVDRLQLPVVPVPLPLGLRDAAERGDRTVLLDALPPADPGLCLSSAGLPAEFHDVATYVAKADGAGYFRLPPMHRLAQVRLDVGPASTQFFVDPDYSGAEQWLELVIP